MIQAHLQKRLCANDREGHRLFASVCLRSTQSNHKALTEVGGIVQVERGLQPEDLPHP
jgi:hypothetical protein